MKTLPSIAAVLLVGAAAPCGAVESGAIDQQTMIIIASTGANGGPNGIAMMRLTFPSPASCSAAKKIMEQDIRGGFVTARCLPTH